MAVEERLVRFVEHALSRGVSREALGEALAAAGWSAEAIRDGLGAFADTGLPFPVPRPRPYVSAKEAFLYLVLFTSLYLWCWHLGSLVFELINNAFPDPAQRVGYSSRAGDNEELRWSAAWIVVAFPVFLGLSYQLGKAVRKEPSKRASRVRKWLTYLTLYVAATVILSDLATLIYNALGGELTARFLLKVLTVAVLAGGAFFYYLTDLRHDEMEEN